ncbi:TolC family protein [Chitinivorax sp. PXF-14]|uniref:TolC family protein n=1 Tax=Chitinivorax sp. PXF-14 TaxID=3230488 RepID=UPI0034659CC2
MRATCLTLLALIALPSVQAETLDQAWAEALASSQVLKSSAQQQRAAAATLSAAQGARWPSLSVESAYTRLNEAPAVSASLPLPAPLPHELTLPISDERFHTRAATVTLPLFTSGRIHYGIEAARAGVAMSDAESQRTAQDVKLAVTEAYFNVLRARQLREVARHLVDGMQRHRHDVEQFYRQGLVAKADLLTIDVALADARQKQIQADNAVDLSAAAYNRSLQRPLGQTVALDDTQLAADARSLDELTALAQRTRPELAQLEQARSALSAQARMTRGEDGPQVALIGGYQHLENPYLKQDSFRSLSIGVKWNVFDGGVVRHRAAALDAKAEALQAQQDDARSWIALDVRQAYNNQREAQARLELATSTVAQAEEALRVARDRYANSLAPQSEVLDAETREANAQSNYHNARYDLQLAVVRIRRAVGEL